MIFPPFFDETFSSTSGTKCIYHSCESVPEGKHAQYELHGRPPNRVAEAKKHKISKRHVDCKTESSRTSEHQKHRENDGGGYGLNHTRTRALTNGADRSVRDTKGQGSNILLPKKYFLQETIPHYCYSCICYNTLLCLPSFTLELSQG